MDTPTRDELERRLNALVADFLDAAEADFPEGFDFGPVMLVAETRTRWDGEVALRRSDGGYVPAADAAISFRTWCSDWREWVQAELLKEAGELYRRRDVYTPRDGDEWRE
jgi:hypothetical protein